MAAAQHQSRPQGLIKAQFLQHCKRQPVGHIPAANRAPEGHLGSTSVVVHQTLQQPGRSCLPAYPINTTGCRNAQSPCNMGHNLQGATFVSRPSHPSAQTVSPSSISHAGSTNSQWQPTYQACQVACKTNQVGLSRARDSINHCQTIMLACAWYAGMAGFTKVC